MIAHWMRVGFVHGVMNTDNMSILGLTIDYGPYGWLEDYDPDWTPNTTDARRPPLPLRPAAAGRALEPDAASPARWCRCSTASSRCSDGLRALRRRPTRRHDRAFAAAKLGPARRSATTTRELLHALHALLQRGARST